MRLSTVKVTDCLFCLVAGVWLKGIVTFVSEVTHWSQLLVTSCMQTLGTCAAEPVVQIRVMFVISCTWPLIRVSQRRSRRKHARHRGAHEKTLTTQLVFQRRLTIEIVFHLHFKFKNRSTLYKHIDCHFQPRLRPKVVIEKPLSI